MDLHMRMVELIRANTQNPEEAASEIIKHLQGEGILNVDGECEVCGDEIPLNGSEENDFSYKCESCREQYSDL